MDHIRRYWWLVALVALAAALELFGVLAEAEGSAVRITVCNPVGPGAEGRCYGSGTIIARDDQGALVLTCAHLFDDGDNTIYVCAGESGCSPAKLVARDRIYDLAALEIGPLPVEPAAIAASAPAPGEMVYACGYGPDGRYQRLPCRVLGYAVSANQATRETLMTTGAARDGDSGGPVYDRAGHVVGVLWGTDSREIAGTCCTRIRTFLQGLRGRFAGRFRGGGGQPAQPRPPPDASVPPATPPVTPLVPIAPSPPTPLDPGDPAIPPAESQPATPSIGVLLEEFAAQGDRLQAIEEQLSGDALGAVVREQLGPLLDPIRQQLGQVVRNAVPEMGAPATSDASGDAAGGPGLWSIVAALLAGAAPPTLAAMGITWLARRGLKRIERRLDARRAAAAAATPPPVAVAVSEPRGPRLAPVEPDPSIEVEPQREQRNRYVHVTETDHLGEAYKEAIAKYAEANPRSALALKTIEEMAKQIHHGRGVADRWQPQT